LIRQSLDYEVHNTVQQNVTRSPASIRVAVVEDRAEDRDGLRELLSASPGFLCVAAFSSGLEALEFLPDLQPEIVLMDIQLPGLSGIECVAQLSRVLSKTQFMMVTVLEDHDLIFRSLTAGATGYLLKKTPPAKLLDAIRELHAGGAPMSGQVARKVVAAFRHPPAGNPASAKLSPIEQSVLQRLARGLLYKEVAEEMNISVSTVRTHVWHIYRKLQVHNRTEAILKMSSGS
jgi:DNA-binding NarL/FixJ family response regulator